MKDKISLTDELLSKAAAEYMDAYVASLSGEDIPEEYEPSPGYRAGIDRLITRMELRDSIRRYARNAAALFLVCLLGAAGFLGINTEARADFLAWLRSGYESSIIYRYAVEAAEAPLPDCELTWVPDGYELTDSFNDENHLALIYENGEGDGIVFSCNRMTEYSLMQIGLTKEYTSEIMSINGCDAELFRFDDGETSLIWLDNESGFIYSVSGTANESVILHIAKNINIAK